MVGPSRRPVAASVTLLKLEWNTWLHARREGGWVAGLAPGWRGCGFWQILLPTWRRQHLPATKFGKIHVTAALCSSRDKHVLPCTCRELCILAPQKLYNVPAWMAETARFSSFGVQDTNWSKFMAPAPKPVWFLRFLIETAKRQPIALCSPN